MIYVSSLIIYHYLRFEIRTMAPAASASLLKCWYLTFLDGGVTSYAYRQLATKKKHDRLRPIETNIGILVAATYKSRKALTPSVSI